MPSFRTLHRIRQQLFGDAVLIDDEAALGSDSTKPEKRVIGHAATEDLSHRWTVANTNNGLVKLPTELHMMIMEQLTFGQVESLRRTCRALRGRISKPVIREVFPGIKFELLSTCYRCLCYDPLRDTLIRADESDARYPLASECLDCVAARGGFMVGRRYTLGTWASVWVCRYCGYPVTSGAAWNEPEFHRACYRRFHWMLFYFFLVGIAQAFVTIIGSALCWGYYNKEKLVLAPTIVSSPYVRVQTLATPPTGPVAGATGSEQDCRHLGLLDVPAERGAKVSGEMVVDEARATARLIPNNTKRRKKETVTKSGG
ncbi:uncharacterized protein NECHADRAFT_29997 [Fusarium vanettenii 77-13-4]|uniref:F-box domain-containing protein n=1 Tax=Fusarium vanettenii (strain ATCC MYA-4622 / CBS 123669 / FGSC 9596 / NRRL 45880 / 77-13-4) TaxID=660122 RepID=C7YW48_FUSV7|nr:uncharacterized protein NECHADRAFT_29997 [Fusarium vanettenii 77-13-4]EEU43905.1 hypothetical protein NECHADRAFT_29997 [Fusarium vanettenii 77-13-4]